MGGKILGGHNDYTFHKWQQKVILISLVNHSLSFAFFLGNIVLTFMPMEALPIFSQNIDSFANIILRRISKKCKHLADFYEKWCLSSISYHWIKKENKPRTRPLEYIQISYDKEAHFLSYEIMNTKYHYLLSVAQISSHNLFMMSLSWSPSSLQDKH